MTNTTNIQNTSENLDFKGKSWVDREFAFPDRTIRLATSFSGIGAIEYAMRRLGLKSKIVFAGDIDANCKKSYFANYEIKEEQWRTRQTLWGTVQMLTQNCCQTIHKEWYVFDSFHLCAEAFDLRVQRFSRGVCLTSVKVV